MISMLISTIYGLAKVIRIMLAVFCIFCKNIWKVLKNLELICKVDTDSGSLNISLYFREDVGTSHLKWVDKVPWFHGKFFFFLYQLANCEELFQYGRKVYQHYMLHWDSENNALWYKIKDDTDKNKTKKYIITNNKEKMKMRGCN